MEVSEVDGINKGRTDGVKVCVGDADGKYKGSNVAADSEGFVDKLGKCDAIGDADGKYNGSKVTTDSDGFVDALGEYDAVCNDGVLEEKNDPEGSREG